MPAPSTLVTFTDADGDEFPIRVEGWWTTTETSELVKQARKRLAEFVEAGELKPTDPVKPTRVERI